MRARNAEAVQIAARLEEQPDLLGEVLVILGVPDVTRDRAVTVAAAESITVLQDAQAVAGLCRSLYRALDGWIRE